MKRIKEWISIRIAKTPGAVVLIGIIFINILLFIVSAAVISRLAPPSLENRDFWSSIFYTVSMVLDAGCVQYVVEDVGEAGALLVIVCMVIVILGMVVFTGAVIGYVSNWISGFIDKANSGDSKLYLSEHTVIINWNTRASEIINDFMYLQKKQKIVVLVPGDKTAVEKEISERLSETIAMEKRNGTKVKNKLTVIVREGETHSTKQLNDIGVSQAKSVIILDTTGMKSVCKYDRNEKLERQGLGNANTIKTLVQVAQITSDQSSRNDQQIVVEVGDTWTYSVVNRIIAHKMKKGKCNIVPVSVDLVLGQILSQFSITPELNSVYSTLFSNKGAAFYCDEQLNADEKAVRGDEYVERVLAENSHAVPLTTMEEDNVLCRYYMACDEASIHSKGERLKNCELKVDINPDFQMGTKNVVILGHNSKVISIMEGFKSFCGEWKDADLNILVMDDKKNLERRNYYKEYSFVKQCIFADVFDRELIFETVNKFIDENDEDTSILILSDDTVDDGEEEEE